MSTAAAAPEIPVTTPAATASTVTPAAVPAASPVSATPPAAPAPLLADAVKTDAAAVTPPAEAVKAEAPKAETKVEAYELKAPEGSTLSADEVKGIESFARDNGLTKAQAEQVLARESTSRVAQVEKTASDWRAQTEKQFGAKLDATVADAKRALLAFATPDERKAIVGSPFANHPVLVSILARAAAALPVEDLAYVGTSPGRADLDAAHTIYGGFGKH